MAAIGAQTRAAWSPSPSASRLASIRSGRSATKTRWSSRRLATTVFAQRSSRGGAASASPPSFSSAAESRAREGENARCVWRDGGAGSCLKQRLLDRLHAANARSERERHHGSRGRQRELEQESRGSTRARARLLADCLLRKVEKHGLRDFDRVKAHRHAYVRKVEANRCERVARHDARLVAVASAVAARRAPVAAPARSSERAQEAEASARRVVERDRGSRRREGGDPARRGGEG
jgi:hypothetical protein